MKIFFFIPRLESGGAERQLAALAAEAARLGHAVTVGVFCEGGIFWDELSRDGAVRLINFNRKGRWDFIGFLSRIARHIKAEKYDVVQSFLPAANVFGTLAAALDGVRRRFTGIRCSEPFDVGAGPKLYRFLDRVVSNIFAAAIVYNSFAGRERHEAKGFKRGKGRVIWNCVAAAPKAGARRDDARRNLGVPAGAFVVAMVARTAPMKDFATLIEAFGAAAAREPRLFMLLVGKEDAGTRASLEKRAAALGVAEKVRFLGERGDVPEIFAAVDAVVHSSLAEGLPNVVIEAMAAGLPVVATDVGDTAKMLADGRGVVVKPRDAAAMADAILRLAKGEKLADTDAARRFVESELAVERLARDYIELYEKGAVL